MTDQLTPEQIGILKGKRVASLAMVDALNAIIRDATLQRDRFRESVNDCDRILMDRIP